MFYQCLIALTYLKVNEVSYEVYKLSGYYTQGNLPLTSLSPLAEPNTPNYDATQPTSSLCLNVSSISNLANLAFVAGWKLSEAKNLKSLCLTNP